MGWMVGGSGRCSNCFVIWVLVIRVLVIQVLVSLCENSLSCTEIIRAFFFLSFLYIFLKLIHSIFILHLPCKKYGNNII